jgi:hypothetical protein
MPLAKATPSTSSASPPVDGARPDRQRLALDEAVEDVARFAHIRQRRGRRKVDGHGVHAEIAQVGAPGVHCDARQGEAIE